MILRAIVCCIASFLAGGVPFSHLIARLRGVDLRTVGSGNVGATNLARSAGYGLGALGFLLDAAKGAFGPLLARFVLGDGAPPSVAAVAGVLAVLGHAFSPFLGFRGGKGVATGAGVFAILAPRAMLVSTGLFVVAVAITRIVGVGSIVSALSLPVACVFLGADRAVTAAAALVALLVLWRHRSNVERLLRGTEPRFGAGGSA